MSDSAATQGARAARNQSLYREVNERVSEINAAFNSLSPVSEWLCECANVECFDNIQMTYEEYEHIRADPARFVVKPDDDHVWPEAEEVTERHERYWVVEKIGVAAELAKRQDPRAAHE